MSEHSKGWGTGSLLFRAQGRGRELLEFERNYNENWLIVH